VTDAETLTNTDAIDHFTEAALRCEELVRLRNRDGDDESLTRIFDRQGRFRRMAAAALEENARLRAALVALTTNPHMNLGDLVYGVREREGLGWEGPAVKAWSDAVQSAETALRKPDAADR